MKLEQKLMVEQALEQFGEAQVKVGGYSMWPFIKPGDVIYITSQARPPYFGKVAVYWAAEQLIAHRVVGRKKSRMGEVSFLISGDFSRNSRVEIPEKDISGWVFQLGRRGHNHRIWLGFPGSWLAVYLRFFIRFLNFPK